MPKANNALLTSDKMGEEALKPADEQYGVVSTPSHFFGLQPNQESVMLLLEWCWLMKKT